MRTLKLALVYTLLVNSAMAAVVLKWESIGKLGAVPSTFTFTAESARRFNVVEGADVETTFTLSMVLLAALPPKMDKHLFKWETDKDVLSDKRIEFLAMTREDTYYKKLIKNSPDIPKDLDFITLSEKDGDTLVIKVVILVDRIFWDEEKKVKPAFMADLNVGMARALYGDIQRLLETPMKNLAKERTGEELVQQALDTYGRTIYYLEQLKDHPLYDKLTGDTKDRFAELLKAEKKSLDRWKNRVKKEDKE